MKKEAINPHVFCGTGDNLYNHEVEPVDSPETINAMFEWMADTYGVKRMYWRGGQEDIWVGNYQFGDRFATPGRKNAVTDYHESTHDLYRQGLSMHAIDAAKRNGMEIFLYTGLFEHGPQPDVGVLQPFLIEDTLRINNPHWAPLDRWQQRRSPGPISFAYPEAREILVKRYVDEIVGRGYDGVNFYTYVENLGLRYEDEFGYNPPIIEEFKKRYPDVDIENDIMTTEQKAYLYLCRGRFVTQFLAELREQLEPNGKKISMILDATNPDYPQPWWGHELRGTGNIRLEWESWIEQGLVDEIWVQLGPTQDQRDLLDRLLTKCEGTPIKLTVRTIDPFDPGWLPYIERGVTPVAVITWKRNGIERITLAETSLETLRSPDWKIRAQTLADIASGNISADVDSVAEFTTDPHVLVRHRAMRALATIGGEQAAALLEDSLNDPESSVRTAAVAGLGTLRLQRSVIPILQAIEMGELFQFKNAAAMGLSKFDPETAPLFLEYLNSPSRHVREVCIRVLNNMQTPDNRRTIYQAFRNIMLDKDEDITVRSWAILRLAGGYRNFKPHLEETDGDLVTDLVSLMNSGEIPKIETDAATGIQAMAGSLTPNQKEAALVALEQLFRQYGDDSTRPDAAYGWRLTGNAILALGGNAILEKFRKQTDDQWLAWNAYEVEFLFQDLIIVNRRYIFNVVDEEQAIADQRNHAPAFPGWRQW